MLAALPREEYERLISGAERVRLKRGAVLLEAGVEVTHAYFLLSGMASLVSPIESGKTVEVAAVGSGGMVGIPAILCDGRSPYEVVMQLPGAALKVRAGALRREFERGSGLRNILLGHALWLLTHITQSAACHRFHTVEERLARWLLMAHDHAGSDTFNLTQELLASMLGVPRTIITALAGAMQTAGMISYNRGSITLIKRRELEAVSCECYRVVMQNAARLAAA
jgi:CRP-like cAMP-binding protein